MGVGTWSLTSTGQINPLVSVSSLVKSGSGLHQGSPQRTPHWPPLGTFRKHGFLGLTLDLLSLDLQDGAWESGVTPQMIWSHYPFGEPWTGEPVDWPSVEGLCRVQISRDLVFLAGSQGLSCDIQKMLKK